MDRTQECISKGVYQYSQVDKFVLIKHYMFVRVDGAKALVLRLFNDMSFPVDSLKYTVIQLDYDGNVIKKTPVEHNSVYFPSKTTFVTEEGIPVDERCVNFKIIFRDVISGRYRYTVKNRRVVVNYIGDINSISEGDKKPAVRFSAVAGKGKRKTWPAVLTAIAVLALVFSMNLSYISSSYVEVRKGQALEKLYKSSFTAVEDAIDQLRDRGLAQK